jgi:hypothetical protein
LIRVWLALHYGEELGWVIFRISLLEALLFAEPRGKRIFYKKCWLQLVVDWFVGTAEGKDVS